MDPLWQNLAALAVVMAASVYLGYKAWQVFSYPSGSGCHCHGCPAEKGANKPLVKLASPPKEAVDSVK